MNFLTPPAFCLWIGIAIKVGIAPPPQKNKVNIWAFISEYFQVQGMVLEKKSLKLL